MLRDYEHQRTQQEILSKWRAYQDSHSRANIRKDLVNRLIPYFSGDDVNGLIVYASKLEDFIVHGNTELNGLSDEETRDCCERHG